VGRKARNRSRVRQEHANTRNRVVENSECPRRVPMALRIRVLGAIWELGREYGTRSRPSRVRVIAFGELLDVPWLGFNHDRHVHHLRHVKPADAPAQRGPELIALLLWDKLL